MACQFWGLGTKSIAATKRQFQTQNQMHARTMNARTRGPAALAFAISQYVATEAPMTPIDVPAIILGLI